MRGCEEGGVFAPHDCHEWHRGCVIGLPGGWVGDREWGEGRGLGSLRPPMKLNIHSQAKFTTQGKACKPPKT